MPGKKQTSSTLSVLLILAVLSFHLCNTSVIQDLSNVLSPLFTQQALQTLSIAERAWANGICKEKLLIQPHDI